ncbi:MAG: hypothetical protein ABSE73_25905 [Planctomycetota bacterium]
MPEKPSCSEQNVPGGPSQGLAAAPALLAAYGVLCLTVFCVLLLAARWEWSLFMDDVSHISWMPRSTDLLGDFRRECETYWQQGRFYPVKFLACLLKYHFLPADPLAFRIFNFGVLAAAAALGAAAIRQHNRHVAAGVSLLFLLGLALSQRALPIVVLQSSLGEGWVILFFAAGLACRLRRPVLSRLFFLLCALSKEPAVTVFLASAVCEWWAARQAPAERVRRRVACVFDVAAFALLLAIVLWAKSSGTYLESYSLFTVSSAAAAGVAMAKCSIILLPPLAVLAVLWRQSGAGEVRRALRQWLASDLVRLCLLFGLAYMYLAAARAPVSYLLIPPAFCMMLVSGYGILEMAPVLERGRIALWTLLAGLCVCLGLSLYYFQIHAASLNESMGALQTLFCTPSPRLVLFRHEEAFAQAQLAADAAHAPVTARQLSLQDLDAVAAFRGDVVLFDAATACGPCAPQDVEALRQKLGGWTRVVDRGVYRLYYAEHRLGKR